MKAHILLVFTAILLISNNVFSQDRYWIGGTGQWKDSTHWSATSGGVLAASVPTTTDNVHFDNMSGLASDMDTVYMDSTIINLDLNLSLISNSFTVSSVIANIEIRGSIIGNAFGLNFDWNNGMILMNPTVAQTITSGAIIWVQDFDIVGTNMISLSDNLSIGTNQFLVSRGSFDANGNTLNCGNFISNTSNIRSVDISNSVVNCSDSLWLIDLTPNLTWNSTSSTINVVSTIDTFTFVGANLAYDSIRSVTPLMQIYGSNSASLLESQFGFQINNDDTLIIDSLQLPSSCFPPFRIASINDLGVSAYIEKSGFANLSLSGMLIDNVDALSLAAQTYTISSSDTINGADGWEYIAQNYYWIGGTGNWSDTSNWSLTSGGLNTSCLPGTPDNVFFDALSGLASIADVVSFDIPFTVHDFTYTNVPGIFSFSGATPSVEIQGDLSANGFANFTWNGGISLNPYAPVTVTSIGQEWNSNFTIIGTDSVTMIDDFNNLQDIDFQSGVLLANNINVTCFDFISNTITPRGLEINSTVIDLNGNNWTIDSTGLVLLNTPSKIKLNNIGAVTFTGGHQVYDTIKSFCDTIIMYNDNTFQLFELDSSNLTLDNGSLQKIDSLISFGDCVNRTIVKTIDPLLASASIQKMGYTTFIGSGLSINNVDALQTTTEVYNLSASDTINAIGWNYLGSSYYWVNDGGKWSDSSHWSFTSGGLGSGCKPTRLDSVYFDNLSFTLAGERVNVDSLAEFSKMDWTTTAFASTLFLDTNILSYGDVTLYPDLLVTRDSLQYYMGFIENSLFNPDGSYIDCSIAIDMLDTSHRVSLLNFLEMSDSSGIVLRNGGLITQNNNILTGDFVVLNDTLSGADARYTDLGSSQIDIYGSFTSETDTTYNFYAGTSIINIGDTLGKRNSLKTNGLTFNEVNLNFQALANVAGTPTIQEVSGTNSFNRLTVAKGSHVYFEEVITQTIVDSLIMIGDCRDYIYIFSTDTAAFTAANINSITTAADLQFVNYFGITNTGSMLTTYYRDSLNALAINTNWTFDTSAPITANFAAVGPYCFNDTTLFTNSSSSNTGPINYTWNYNDGSSNDATSALIKANNSSFSKTYPQTTGISTDSLEQLVSWTETLDGLNLFTPATGAARTITDFETMKYDFTVGYSFTLINNHTDTAYLVPMSDTSRIVSYDFQPSVEIYKNGIPINLEYEMNEFSYPEESFLTSGSDLLITDTVSFSLSAYFLDSTDVLTVHVGAHVDTYSLFGMPKPRWKSDTLKTSPDVSVTYKLDIDTIHIEAVPTNSNYMADTLEHQFLESGDLTVTLLATNDLNFCTDTASQIVHINNANAALVASVTDTDICLGDSVAFSALALSPDLDFQFYLNGDSLNTPPSPTDTLYTTDTLANNDWVGLLAFENGCPADAMDTIYFTVNELPVITWFTSDSDSTICATDSVYFTQSGGTASQYFINGTPTSGFLSDSLRPITYGTNSLGNNDSIYVLVRDDSTQCYNQSDTMIFTVHPLPTTTLITDVLVNNICDGTPVTFTGSGADLYQFFIDTISQGPASATNVFIADTLSTGNVVSVVGYSSQGCISAAPETYSYSITPLPNVSMSFNDLDTSICGNTNVNFNAFGASTYEFFLNDGTSLQGPLPTSTYSSTTLAHNDSIYVIGGFSGCSDTSDIIVFEVLVAPTTTLVSDDVDSSICKNTLVEFTSTGALTYQFFVNGISQGAASATNTFTTSTLTNGQTISVIGTTNSCTVSQSIPFEVLALPSLPLFSNNPSNAICEGGTITFTTANANLYEFFSNENSLGAPSTSPTLSPTLPAGIDTITVIGTALNGCIDTSATVIIVEVTAIPIMTLTTPNNVICDGQSVTFTGSGSDQFQFLFDGNTQGSMSANNIFTTTNLNDGQIVTVNGSTNGCIGSSSPIVMTVNNVPNVILTPTDVNNTFCFGDLETYTASGATNYEFFVDGNSQGSPSATNVLLGSTLSVGTYPIIVIGESNNCPNQASLNVTVYPLPVANITSSILNDTICELESISYTATGGANYEFFINGASQGGSSPLNVFTSSTLSDGDSVSVTVSSITQCTSDASTNLITVLPLPVMSLTQSDFDTTICSGDSVTFTAAGATEYEFYVNGISQGAPSTTNEFITTSLLNADNVYVIGTLGNCKTVSNDFTFNVNYAPLVLFLNNGPETTCTGLNTNLIASGATNYQFYINADSTGAFSPVNTFSNTLNNGDVVTVIGESNGCKSLSDSSYTFTVYDYPTLVATASNVVICTGDQVDFIASGAMTYTFDLNGNTIQDGVAGNFSTTTLAQGDVIDITGYNGTCASPITSYTFTVNSMNLDLTVSSSSMICENELASFTATGADQYEFFLNGISTGALGTNNVFTSTTLNDQDEITFIGFNNTTTCFQDYSDFIIMNIIETPAISALSSTTFCDGDSVQLVSNSLYGNQWVLDGTPITGATDTMYTALVGGTYSLESTSGGNGSLWSFGQNATGTFANGNNFNNANPTPANSAIQFDEISSGADFILAVSNTGDVYSWGENSSGQLGDGTYTNTNLPNIVPTVSNVKTIATTASSSMAVLTTGEVYVWGNNTLGQLGTGNTSVINFPMLNAGITNTDSIAGGKSHFVILKNDGTVWAVGNNDFGQLGQGDLTSSMNPVQINALTNIVSVGAGEYHSFAIDNLGNLYTWGNNGSGQLGLDDLTSRLSPILSPLKNIINAQGGASHSVFLSSNNEIYTSGDNSYGQLGTGAFAATKVPQLVSISGVNMISAGQYTTLIKRNDNSVFGFGNNTEDQLSSSTGNLINVPEHISSLDNVDFIEAGKSASHVIYQEEKLCVSTNTAVTVNTVPVITVTINNDSLTTIAGASYQWFLDGLPIIGGNSQTFVATTTGNYSVQVTFANGCTGMSAENFISFVGIEDIELGLVKIYPNPTSNIINISVENELFGLTTLNVLDQSGRIVSKEYVSSMQNYSMDVLNLESGIYYIQIENQGRKITLKFIKTND